MEDYFWRCANLRYDTPIGSGSRLDVASPAMSSSESINEREARPMNHLQDEARPRETVRVRSYPFRPVIRVATSLLLIFVILLISTYFVFGTSSEQIDR